MPQLTLAFSKSMIEPTETPFKPSAPCPSKSPESLSLLMISRQLQRLHRLDPEGVKVIGVIVNDYLERASKHVIALAIAAVPTVL